MMVRVVLGALVTLWAAMPAAAQGGKMTLEGELTEVVTDQDGRSFYRELDQNDNLCALIKVTVVGELPNELIMEVGSLGVHKRIYDPNSTGELWFYVPYQTKNIWLKCATLDPIGPLPVRLSEGAVYRLKVRSNATSKVVTNVELSANYLKVVLNAEGATISLGKSKECEMLSRIVNGNIFSVRLDYGTYHYRIEHPDYMTATGSVEVSGTMGDLNVELRPAWGTLEIESSPEGAAVYVSGRRVGTTPCTVERVKAGEVEVRLQHDYCYPLTDKVEVASGGETTRRNYQLRLQVGKVTVKCPDREAEIWIDNKLYGKGSWTGYISSLSSHIVEARRDGYASQSAEFSVEDESTAMVEIAAPVAYYGTLDLAVEPMMAQVEVDGNAVGTAPVMLQLTATSHKVRLTAEGYHPDEFEVTIGHNSTTMISRQMSQVKPIEEKESAFVKVEVMPSFMGGDLNTFRNWFSGEFEIPAIAAENGVQGKVVMKFVIEKDGSVGDIEFLQSPDKVYEDEARRVLMKSPKWTPGRQRGQLVRVYYILPIECRLN